MGLADDLPVLLVVAVALLLAELPLALLVRSRHSQAARAQRAPSRLSATPAAD